MDAQLRLPLADPAADALAALPGPPLTTARHAPTPRAPSPAGVRGPRLGELLGGLSYALDMAEGLPPGHGLRSCWISQQLGAALGLNTIELRELYYATLLKDAGGSSNAALVSRLFLADDRAVKRDHKTMGRSLPARLHFVVGHTGPKIGLAGRCRAVAHVLRHGRGIARELTEARSQRGAQIARQLRFSEAVAEGIRCLDEHWDGSGHPRGLAGDDIPLYARIALLAQVADMFHASAGPQAARAEVARRSRRWLDPHLAQVFDTLARDPAFWNRLADDDLDRQVLELEPARQSQPVDEDHLDDIAAAFGRIVDAKSAFTAGHSTRVARVADLIGRQLGLDDALRRWLRRGALLHDVGKLGVSNTLLDKPGPLDLWERAAMQRHAVYTEEILGRIGGFGVLARVAGAHHEKLDGNGYPRGLDARHIRLETRIVTTADIFDALTADRPHRAALTVAQALDVMRGELGTAIDAECFAALVRALGEVGAP